ncbi:hypothetical protein, partial [Neisseria sp. HMSC065D04]|uniref:hypothetical protein n=1 Tax=Neisseria sp. HMSC065D04 TaxID=1739542 RepID=UPI001AF01360
FDIQGRILESDIIRTFIGYKYPNTAPKGRLKLKPPSRLNASDVACFARENQRRRSDSRIRRYQGHLSDTGIRMQSQRSSET